MPKPKLSKEERAERKAQRIASRQALVAAGGASSFSVPEVAQRNNLSHVTIYHEINSGKLRSFKVGRQRRVSADAEADWIRSREEATA